ncbi:major facilitator superfamily protein [Stylonychia lemnae]|uniref:Major facilitator superfamily protein n=1 Tax=Stylonychia lemnae TaxID=5949 RepID=A0A078A9C5_STYLE|nr:major facilitator superfamily protein [Stylonychia lemnae]|eukprot:CDW78451.1 major facilitator superfamily protein [Stylonychia lemnae]
MTLYNLIIFASHFIPNDEILKDKQIKDIDVLEQVSKISRMGGVMLSYQLIKSLGEVNTMSFGSMIGAPFILSRLTGLLKSPIDYESELYPDWFQRASDIFFSVCNGASEGITVPALLKYIVQLTPLKHKGLFFGYNWGFYHIAHLLGYVSGYFWFEGMSLFDYIVFLWGLTLFTSFMFFMSTQNKSEVDQEGKIISNNSLKSSMFELEQDLDDSIDQQESPKTHYNQATLDQFSPFSQARLQSANIILSNRIDLANDDQDESEEEFQTSTFLENLKSFKELLSYKKYQLFLPMVIQSSMCLPFIFEKLPDIILTQENEHSGSQLAKFTDKMRISMIGCFGNIVGSMFIGLLIDIKGFKLSIYTNMGVAVILYLSTMIYISDIVISTFFESFVIFAWGFQDGSINTQVELISGFEFQNDGRPFCIYFFTSSIVYVIISLIQIGTHTLPAFSIFFSVYLFYFIGALGMGSRINFIMDQERIETRKKKRIVKSFTKNFNRQETQVNISRKQSQNMPYTASGNDFNNTDHNYSKLI